MKKLILVLALFATTLFAGYQAPLNVKGAKTIESKEAFEMYNNGAKFLDVRPLRFLKSGKIKGTLHLYVDEMTKYKLSKLVKKDEAVIFYCNGAGCPLSAKALKLAVQYGYTKLYYYRDGIPAWKYYKLPIEN